MAYNFLLRGSMSVKNLSALLLHQFITTSGRNYAYDATRRGKGDDNVEHCDVGVTATVVIALWLVVKTMAGYQ